jgi:hypothetical protein
MLTVVAFLWITLFAAVGAAGVLAIALLVVTP